MLGNPLPAQDSEFSKQASPIYAIYVGFFCYRAPLRLPAPLSYETFIVLQLESAPR